MFFYVVNVAICRSGSASKRSVMYSVGCASKSACACEVV